MVEEQFHGGAEEQRGERGGLEFIFGATPRVQDLKDHYRELASVLGGGLENLGSRGSDSIDG